MLAWLWQWLLASGLDDRSHSHHRRNRLVARLRLHNQAPEQLVRGLTFHQQEEDQLRGDLLGGAGEEGLRKGWEVLGGRGGYGSGVGGEALVQCCDQSLIRPNSFGGAATL